MAALATSATERSSKYGTVTFADPGDCDGALGGARVLLTVTGSGDFKTRLTSLDLGHLQVLRGCEELPRIAYVSLPPSRIFVSFPTGEAPLIWDGIGLRRGDIVFHSRSERMHQRTTGQGRWGLMSLPAQQLASCSKSLIGRKITWPPVGRMLQPQPIAARRLLRLHAKAAGLAEAKHKLLDQPEFVQTLERELLHALVECLTVDDPGRDGKRDTRHANIMALFENALTAHAGYPLTIFEICASIGVPERTLRACCAEFLGVGPTRYLLLRRLNMARSALRRADPASTSVAEIARQHQFSELGRFAVTYRTIFGEMPSTTLRSTPHETPNRTSFERPVR
jgi:AraC-like DNA-binding protein